MKNRQMNIIFILVLSLLTAQAFADSDVGFRQLAKKKILGDQQHRLPLDLESSDYESWMKWLRIRVDVGPEVLADVITEEDVVQFLIKKGGRNAEFLKFITSKKPPGSELAFTNPELQKKSGIPIDKPKTYSPAILRTQLNELQETMPAQLKEIILGVAPFSYPLQVSDEDYLTWARKIDKMYQTASRWKLMEPYLEYLSERKAEDIRGYYFLNKEDGLQDKLTNWSSLATADQERLLAHLDGLCFQAQVPEQCSAQLRQAISQYPKNQQALLSFYLKKLPAAEEAYKKFFVLQNPRPEAIWNSFDAQTMKFPFRDPKNDEIRAFVKDNIEDEWKFMDWKLILDFIPTAPVSVIFQPGVTPHVNGLGGDSITMDSNQPMSEFGTQWTIRHEFGHVLGLPDCYIEFYDKLKKEIVSYQIDITNIMCSRAGHLQQIHVDELKKSYFKSSLED